MAINPLIALGGQPIDTATPLQNVIKIQDLKQRQDLRERQAQQDERRLDMGARQLDMQQAEADRAAYNDRVESTLIGSSVLDSFLQDNDTDGARVYLQRRAKSLIDAGRDPGDTLEAIQLLDSDPEQLRAIASAGRREAGARGLIQEGESGFTLGEGQVRFDGYGRELARGPEKDDTMSEGRMRQEIALRGAENSADIKKEIELIKLRRELEKDDPERIARIEKLQLDTAKARAEVAADAEKKKKADDLVATTRRLIGELLENTDAIKGVVGPGEKFYPDIARSDAALQAGTKINQLKSILTADNLTLMSGVLSESDMQVISAIAGGGLDVGGSEDGFIEELQRMATEMGVDVGVGGSQGKPKRIRFDAQGNRID